MGPVWAQLTISVWWWGWPLPQKPFFATRNVEAEFEHITLTLQDDLHWLPVPETIVFKFCTIIIKCLHQTALHYLQELCIPVTASTSHCYLHSATHCHLQVLVCWTASLRPLWDPTLTCFSVFFSSAYVRALVTALGIRVAHYKFHHLYIHTVNKKMLKLLCYNTNWQWNKECNLILVDVKCSVKYVVYCNE